MISTDTLADNTAFAKKEEAGFPILADPAKETAKKYGVLGIFGGYANRNTFYIGADGKILAIDRKVNPAHAGEAVLAHLKELNVPARK